MLLKPTKTNLSGSGRTLPVDFLPLAIIKKELSIYVDDYDDLINLYTQSVVDKVYEIVGEDIGIASGYESTFPNFSYDFRLDHEAIDVDTLVIKYIDVGESERTLDSALYVIDETSDYVQIKFKERKTDLSKYLDAPISVTYNSADGNKDREVIKVAILKEIKLLWLDRTNPDQDINKNVATYNRLLKYLAPIVVE